MAVSGCVQPEVQKEQLRKKIAETCTNYGFKAGTDAYSNCLMQVDMQQANAERQRRMQVARDVSDISSMNRTSFCTATPVGGGASSVTCN